MKYLNAAILLSVVLLAKPTFAGDSDDDGIPNKFDECKKVAEDKDGFQDNDGCPDPDNDADGVCDPWVAEKGLAAKYPGCKGSDKCVEVTEDKDGFEDGDGCPDPDNDKDGIPDTKDKCPSEPEDMDGFTDNDGCPEPDNDGDGTCDPWVAGKGLASKYASTCVGADKCQEAKEDKDGFEDQDGCPESDNDKDGIKDEVDKCPMEAETVNLVDDEDGCADKAMAALSPVQTYPLVRFRSSLAELTVEAEQPLEQLAKQLKEYPEKKVEVRLYTWYKGKKQEDYLALLQARSKAIVDFLVSKGVNPAQLSEAQYTKENFDAFKGSEQDFNQEKPMEIRLKN
ncbi:MAG: OmpA family protein [Fibrobacterota bacterium]|nr:OmpA family protein [Fibrobacterota bacterium]